MATVLPKVILLRGRGERREAAAAGAIMPGHLVAYNSSGAFVVHPTAAAPARRIFAVENALIGNDIDTAYASGDYVQAEEFGQAADIYALVAASAAAIVIGDKLESAGNGTLRKATPASQSGTTPFAVVNAGAIIAEALEAVDNSAGGSAARIKVAIVP